MSKFMSRKFLLIVAGVLFNLVNAILEAKGFKSLPQSVLDAVNTLIISFVAAEGVADVVSRSKDSDKR